LWFPAEKRFGGVRGQFAAVDRKVLLANETQRRGIEQDVTEQAGDLLLQAADEGCDRGEVQPGIGQTPPGRIAASGDSVAQNE